MRMLSRWSMATALVALLAFVPTGAQAQISASVGGGVATPYGDFADFVESGWTARGQVGLNMLLVGLHAQAGISRFSGKDEPGLDRGNVNTYHYGVGGRFGVGPFIWVGGTAARFGGDGEGSFGIIPEAGVGLGPLEVVADIRVTGDQKWYALRGAFRF